MPCYCQELERMCHITCRHPLPTSSSHSFGCPSFRWTTGYNLTGIQHARIERYYSDYGKTLASSSSFRKYSLQFPQASRSFGFICFLPPPAHEGNSYLSLQPWQGHLLQTGKRKHAAITGCKHKHSFSSLEKLSYCYQLHVFSFSLASINACIQ